MQKLLLGRDILHQKCIRECDVWSNKYGILYLQIETKGTLKSIV